MCVYGPHFPLRCQGVYMVLTLPSYVYVCIWSSVCLEMCMFYIRWVQGLSHDGKHGA